MVKSHSIKQQGLAMTSPFHIISMQLVEQQMRHISAIAEFAPEV